MNCVKYLRRAWNRKEGRGNKKIKKGGGQAGSRGGCLKKGGGLEPPYELWLSLLSKLGKSFKTLMIKPNLTVKYFLKYDTVSLMLF